MDYTAFFARVDDGVDRFNRNVGPTINQTTHTWVRIPLLLENQLLSIKIFTLYNFTPPLIN
jgi:hypothetical protein